MYVYLVFLVGCFYEVVGFVSDSDVFIVYFCIDLIVGVFFDVNCVSCYFVV